MLKECLEDCIAACFSCIPVSDTSWLNFLDEDAELSAILAL